MTVKQTKRLWQEAKEMRSGFQREAKEGFAYYRNENAILGKGLPFYEQQRRKEQGMPLRAADNRICHNFHRLLVNQKAGYFASWAPEIDLGDQESNAKLRAALEGLDGLFYRLSVDASLCGEGWLHLWQGKRGELLFDRMDPRELYPVWDGNLRRTLSGMFRRYRKGEECCLEFWDDEKVVLFTEDKEGLHPKKLAGENAFYHNMGCVPFLLFANNCEGRGDLPQYQALIDLYDQVESGFANDLEDVQQVVLILRNYGGMNLSEFMQDLKKYKAVRVEGGVNEGGLDTLQIEIPVEARKTMLELLRSEIFAAGQGVNPFEEQTGQFSGVALKFKYSQLELKAMEQERCFLSGLRQLVFIAGRMCGLGDKQARFTFIRNTIRSEEEQAAIAKTSEGLVSRYTLLANHPWVTDPEKEWERLAAELQKKEN